MVLKAVGNYVSELSWLPLWVMYDLLPMLKAWGSVKVYQSVKITFPVTVYRMINYRLPSWHATEEKMQKC